jgi:hypothetical protein
MPRAGAVTALPALPADLADAVEGIDPVRRILLLQGEARRLEQEARNCLAHVDAAILEALETTSGAELAEATGQTRQNIHRRATAARAAGWGGPLPISAARRDSQSWLARQAEDFQLARIAQERRADAYSLGYAEEGRAFYGDPSLAAADESEQRLTWKDWVRHSAERSA